MFINHSLHTDYSKPKDQCLECQFEAEVLKAKLKEQRDAQLDVQIDQAIEDQNHHHGERR